MAPARIAIRPTRRRTRHVEGHARGTSTSDLTRRCFQQAVNAVGVLIPLAARGDVVCKWRRRCTRRPVGGRRRLFHYREPVNGIDTGFALILPHCATISRLRFRACEVDMEFRRIAALACAAIVLFVASTAGPAKGNQPAAATPAPAAALAPTTSRALALTRDPHVRSPVDVQCRRRFLIAASSSHSAMTVIGFDAPPIAQSLGSNWPLVRVGSAGVTCRLRLRLSRAQKWTGEYNDVFRPFDPRQHTWPLPDCGTQTSH